MININYLPLSAFTWNKKPAATVEGVLGENVTLEWQFSLVSTNEKFSYFALFQNGDDMLMYTKDVGAVIYKRYNGSVGLASNGTPSFILANLQWSNDKAKFCCKVGTTRNHYSHCVVLKLLGESKGKSINRYQYYPNILTYCILF